MALSSRRSISSFSLSFLDIMFCGFGAVVLLVLIINGNTTDNRNERMQALLQARDQKETRNEITRDHLETLRENYGSLARAITLVEQRKTASLSEMSDLRAQLQARLASTSQVEELSELKQALQKRERDYQQLLRETKVKAASGRQVRPFEGEGNRQYLTGLKVGGKRVLFLVDSSASMLDRKIVDIVRWKVMDAPIRRTAPKWRRAVATVDWILANLPVESSIRVMHFSRTIEDLHHEEDPTWVKITDSPRVDRIIANLRELAPLHGTNLESALSKSLSFTPRPDNIILVTDGLPTLGSRGQGAKTITADKRLKLFEQAVKRVPADVPINVILFPLEGDPLAPVSYWKLAAATNGSFLTPTRDWP
jgi:hypothetical protein